MAEEVAAPFLGKLAQLLVDPIVRQFCYLFQYRSNIENLKDQLNELLASRGGVKIQVDAAEYNIEIVDPGMQSWDKRVDEIEMKASGVIEMTSNVDKKCLNLRCPNVKRRYFLSKTVTKITLGIGKLKREGEKYAKPTHSALPPGIMTADALLPELTTRIDDAPFIRNCEDLVSRRSIFKQVMDALEDDRIRMIGISGIGGVGKTTFVNEVCRKARALNLFEQIAMTAVSQKQDLLKIQNELANMLGLKFLEDMTLSVRAHHLLCRLTNGRKILVILDDVWEEIPLKQVGIPVTGDRGGCKVIFTSRDKLLLVDMGTQLNVKIDVLTPQESRDLFAENCGDYNQHLTAMEIVDNCGSTPIAIVTLAKALRRQAAEVLDSALDYLKQYTVGEETSGMDERVYKSIELCYNLLKDSKAKAFLVLCCLFSEDVNISMEILVGFDCSVDIDVKRRNVSYLVGKLRSFNLLGEGDLPGTVKVHDIVRDVCLSIEGLNKWPQDFSFAKPHEELENGDFGSRKSTFKEILDALIDDQIYKIGICGEGGVGKTKMVYDIREKVLADKLFDDVALTSVSQDTNMSKVQAEVGEMLGLTSTVWDKGDVSARAQLLHERLTNRRSRILVILDDVQDRCDLESIGVPDTSHENSGCKVLITTRLEHICRVKGAQKIIPLGTLSDKDAWELFKHHAGLPEEETSQTRIYYSIGRKIIKEIKPLPLAVVELAHTLKNQRSDEWSNALEKLRYGSGERVMKSSIQMSYEWSRDLNPQAPLLLLLCCIMEEDANVPMEKLVKCVHSVQLFGEVMGLEETRIKVKSLVDFLLSSSLLLQSWQKEGSVRVHQVVRDTVLRIHIPH